MGFIRSNFLFRPVVSILIGFAFLTAFQSAHAELTFGAEFEVVKEGLVAFDPKKDEAYKTNVKKAQLLFVKEMYNRCKVSNCKITKVQASWDYDYVVTYPDGWWFKISYDPGCVEFTFKPSTLKELRKQAALINDQIFGTARDLGFKVDKNGPGHFNVGIRSAFGDDPKKFLRFYVDYANHADLGFGSLGYDLYNAPPLSVLGADQREALQDIVNEANANKFTTIEEVARAIQDRVYIRSYYEPWGGVEHYQSIGLKYAYDANLKEKDVPMEIRAVWSQESAEKFNLIAELIEARVEYLNKMEGPIVYTQIDRKSFTHSELRSRFAIYVEEAGLKYKDFENLLPESIKMAKFDDFIRDDIHVDMRLKDVEKYWDLIPVSEWVQDRVVEMLSNSSVRYLSVAERLLKKMQKIALQKQPKASKGLISSFFGYFAPSEKKFSIEEINVFENILKRVESNRQNGVATRKPVMGISNPIYCPRVFAN